MHARSGGRVRRFAITGAVIITTATLAVGCGSASSGAGVANLAGSSKASNSPSGGSSKASALAYSQCMRRHGIKDFPDPNSNGQIQLSAGPGSDLIPTNPLFTAAQQACKSLMPGPPSLAQQRKDLAAALRFARCMRAHGVTNFPDPKAQTGPQTQSAGPSQSKGSSQGTNGIDPNSPVFQAGLQKCKSLAPGGGLTVQSAGPGS